MAEMIHIIGTGPGDGRYTLDQARETIKRCTAFAGFRSHALRFIPPSIPFIDLSSEGGRGIYSGLNEIERLRLEGEDEIGILVSGDPGFHSLLPLVRSRYPQWELRIVPGLSAFQVACAKIGIPWQELELVSLHGSGGEDIASFVRRFVSHPPSGMSGFVVLTAGPCGGRDLAERIIAEDPGYSGYKAWFCRDIGEEGESIVYCRLDAVQEGGRLCTVIIPRMEKESV
ncbi:precorrin-6y C5,15-methyltransferase (decarboxylating) subunit CbiE [Sediminispirochaeta bajacaliforniensis]|uniref:precorrin-6y C5,15-methyltransferase (decarboxylating) subunit CbiE n=1 Tax=Sediminispirochaeta bajacaliforniensis TaxID=148 RepID=UPI00037DDE96|nr:precorrin-6y C5,15-methyltransferase (decarboxylating) subunit CbiE [Sediminispirochaeta bajacaliforniensis]